MEVYMVTKYIEYNNDCDASFESIFGVFSSIDNAIEAIEQCEFEEFDVDDSISHNGNLFYSKTFISYDDDFMIILNLHKRPLLVDGNLAIKTIPIIGSKPLKEGEN